MAFSNFVSYDVYFSVQSSLKENCLEFLLKQQNLSRESLCLDLKDNFSNLKHDFTIGPFFLPRGPEALKNDHFSFNAPTTATNSLRVMRALQLHRPILLEGSPGVGKTSLVQALAQQAGYSVVRINLSDQTVSACLHDEWFRNYIIFDVQKHCLILSLN